MRGHVVVAGDPDLLAEQPEPRLGGDDDRRVGEVSHGEVCVAEVGARTVVAPRTELPRRGVGVEGGAELQLGLDDAGQPADALADPLGGRVAVGQPHRAGPEAVGEERRARHVGHPGGDRARQHRLRVDAGREGEPDVEAPVGDVPPAGRRHQVVERVDHRVAALAVHLAELLDLALPVVGGEVCRDGHLRELRRAQRRGLLGQHQLLAHRVRRQRPADPEPGREGLGERAEVDHALGLVGPQRPQRLAVEAEQAVGVVLEDQDVLAPADVEDLGPPREPRGSRRPGCGSSGSCRGT